MYSKAEPRLARKVAGHTKEAVWRTFGLIGILLAVFVVQWIVGLDESILRAGLVKPLVRDGDVWRLLTAALMHGSIKHLLANATGILLFGLFIELYGGQWLILPLFVLSALGGNLTSLYLNPHPSLGASGGVMGFLGFLLVMRLRRKELLPDGFGADLAKAIIPTAIVGAVAWSHIDNAAHLGGFLVGAAVGAVIFLPDQDTLPPPRPARGRTLDRGGQFLLTLFAIWTIVALMK